MCCNLMHGLSQQIQKLLKARELEVVGWYHSHPVSEPKPSQSDILSQKKYQEAVRVNDAAAEPCVGVIVSKFLSTSLSLVSMRLLMSQPAGLSTYTKL